MEPRACSGAIDLAGSWAGTARMARMDRKTSTAARRLRAALDLHDDGVEIMRRNLRRRHPSESPAEIEDRLRRWLRRETAAE